MKLIKIFTFALLFAMMLSLISCDIESLLGGAVDEVDDGYSNGLGTENKDDGDKKDEEDKKPQDPDHVCDYKLVSETQASCESAGIKNYKCSCGETKNETVAKLPHTEVIDPEVAPNGNTPGKTEGKHCSVCGFVIVKQEYIFASDYLTPEKYDGDYAYKSLLKLDKAEMLTKLYERIDEAADKFHTDGVDATKKEDIYTVATINYSDLGITSDDAIAVWNAYKFDRPLYYWISGRISYDSNKIDLLCDEDYAKATSRAALNSKIYGGVKEFIEEAYSASKYNTALALHDLIILSIDYAYESDGVTPEDAVWAHNIIGVFDKGYGVCESYAKTFQLLLNYCEIDNIFVSGWANEAHAWNLIQLDDGEWYWCDLTWDDTPEFMWGISYRYFCVTDTENVGWTDGPFTMLPATFISNHTPYGRVDTGIEFNYDLPARATAKFDSAEIMLKDTFDIGNLTFAVAGYNSVQLVAINSNGNVTIPATVTYKGETLNVISIGKLHNGQFYTGSIATYMDGPYTEQYTVGVINIPASVILIWDDALNFDSLTAINVDSANEVYTSVDGVLFSKDLSVLIKYPTAKAGTEYTLSEKTTVIAAGAFSSFYSNTPNMIKLAKLYLGAADVEAGVRDYGYGYDSGKYVEDDAWAKIFKALAKNAVIYAKDGSALE